MTDYGKESEIQLGDKVINTLWKRINKRSRWKGTITYISDCKEWVSIDDCGIVKTKFLKKVVQNE